ncbi:MAG: anti-sigma factor antagonist [Gaiellales bacterium]|nr:anti-sigma factor antagonist [Gaiellales bacterium]
MHGLRVARRVEADATVLELSGEFDLAAEPIFQRELEPALAASKLVLDLSRVTFMDSTGLRLVLEADARVRANGGRCAVVQGSGSVHRLIKLGFLTSRLEIVDAAPADPQPEASE